MADPNKIGYTISYASQSLRQLLLAKMLIPNIDITILPPDETKEDKNSINLFLYKINENVSLRNMDFRENPGNPDKQLIPPPLSLNLFYLVTPYAISEPNIGNSPAHKILGDAMRVFHQYPVVPAEYLVENLNGSIEEIRVMLSNANMDELSQIWSTFTKPFRLSVLYEVSVIQIDMSADFIKDKARKPETINIHVSASIKPPYILKLEPVIASPAAELVITGENLKGRDILISLDDTSVYKIIAAEEKTVRWQLPEDIAEGGHRICVEIEDKFKRFFDITVENPD